MQKEQSKNRIGLLISGGVAVAAPVLGFVTTGLLLLGAFRGTAHQDPSRKAEFLADGISGAMDASIIGFIVSCVAIVPTIIFAVRLSRERARSSKQADGAERPPT
jgi:biopolymer transport protein ExbB/TolQ